MQTGLRYILNYFIYNTRFCYYIFLILKRTREYIDRLSLFIIIKHKCIYKPTLILQLNYTDL
jgi:hypothetical protein